MVSLLGLILAYAYALCFLPCHSFASDGRYIVSRDYLTLKVWDTHMETTPVRVSYYTYEQSLDN